MSPQTICTILLFGLVAWENDNAKPKPYPLGNGDTLMIRKFGYDFCPLHCEVDHFHTGHLKNYDCETEICTHIIYEDRYK